MVSLPRLRSMPLLLAAWIPASLSAQQTNPQVPQKPRLTTGIVTGQVSCADTNAPARFALVTLEPVPPEKSDSDQKSHSSTGMNATATTDIDGRFLLDKVPSGRYYVLAGMPGYLNPLASFDRSQLVEMSGDTRKKLAALVPTVSVEPHQPATLALRLERGAEVNGTVLYDDGSPAVALQLRLLRKNEQGKLIEARSTLDDAMPAPSSRSTTDDRGHYRLGGLPAGEYALQVSLPTETVQVGGLISGGTMGVTFETNPQAGLLVFSGNSFRRKEAKTTKVGEGELVGGMDMTIPLTGLHTVQGTLTAQRDGHALNSGQIELMFADDKEPVRILQVDDAGNFTLTYVPEGQYTVRVVWAADVEHIETHPSPNYTLKSDKELKRYKSLEIPLLVAADVSGLSLVVQDLPPPATPQP